MIPAPTLISVCAFLKRYAPGFRNSDRNRIVPFVQWYWVDARVGIIRERGRIVSAALARCVNDTAEAVDPHYHNEAGKIVWVDDIVSRHPQGIALLLEQVQQRFGPRQAFAGRVFHRSGELRMLPYRIVERMKSEHHGFTINSGTASRA